MSGTIPWQVGSGCLRTLTEHEPEVNGLVHEVSELAGSVPPWVLLEFPQRWLVIIVTKMDVVVV